ncbi:MAG: phenylacetate-CoA oxygenase subunit PaaJ [Actinomycetota bacterium]|nr:phenylacetate-CoA oxygenase subunit PaaJ [Actinomycetota bacterium]
MVTPATAEAVWAALETVADPEIPAVSVVEMGMIASVDVTFERVRVVVLPTFTGCPAIGMIEQDVGSAVFSVAGVEEVEIKMSFDPPWTTGRITPEGRRKLKSFGIAPPTGEGPVLITEIGLPPQAVCPFCGSSDTSNQSLFGPTPCRAIYHCATCKNPFEQFKAV